MTLYIDRSTPGRPGATIGRVDPRILRTGRRFGPKTKIFWAPRSFTPNRLLVRPMGPLWALIPAFLFTWASNENVSVFSPPPSDRP